MPFNRTDPMKERVKFILAWEKRWQESQGGRIDVAEAVPGVRRQPGHGVPVDPSLPRGESRPKSARGAIAAAPFEPHGDLAADSGFHRRCPEGQAPLGAP